MIDYRKDLADIEKLLQENRYYECSMRCGKSIELVLKDLAKDYFSSVTETSRRCLNDKIRLRQPLEKLTLGALSKLYRDEGILKALVDGKHLNHSDLRVLDLDMVARIRNKVAHDRQEDIYLEKSDALLLYGSFIKLLAITGLLAADGSDKEPVISVEDDKEQDTPAQSINSDTGEVQACDKNNLKIRMIPTETEEDESALHQQPAIREKTQTIIAGRAVTLYKNKVSGKYFVYERQIDANTLSLITPTGDLKTLKENLFEECGELQQDEAVDKGLVTTAQIARHRSLEEENTLLQDSMQQSTGQEKKAKISKHHGLDNAQHKHNHDKKMTQDELIPHIVIVLREHGGRALKKEVEQAMYRRFKDTFEQKWYQELVSHGVPRWQNDIAWAKERAKKKGLIKPSGDSGRGFWELTTRGKNVDP